MAIFPLFLSICLSVYSGYLRKKFRINPISIKKAFKSSDDSYFRFREQNNSKIGKLAYLQRMMLVIIGLGYLISLALFLSIFLELINRNPLIRTAPFALCAVSLTLVFDILLQSTSKKKLILQIMEYQHLKAKESLTAPIKDFFGSLYWSNAASIPLKLSTKMLGNFFTVNWVHCYELSNFLWVWQSILVI